MKKLIFISFAVATFFLLWFLGSKSKSNSAPSSQESKPLSSFIPNPQPVRGIASSIDHRDVSKLIPNDAPSQLQSRFGQRKDSEDTEYLRTVLIFDNRPVEQYKFVWAKDANGNTELLTGELPQITGTNGDFPSVSEGSQIVSSAIGPLAEVLKFEEIWLVDDLGILEPYYKVEVQRKAKNKSGHEYWTVSVNTKKVIRSVEADRY